MMGYFYGGYNSMMSGFGPFGAITWLLLITFLVLGCAFFLKELTKTGRK